jgi:L-ribulose-5-phosphate 4-epimerase
LLAFAADAATTADLVIALEEAAEAEIAASMLGGAVDLPADALAAVLASRARSR